MSSRSDAIAEFYEREAEGLRRAVRGEVRGTSALIDDACAFAWSQLLEHQEVVLDGAFLWLYVVAIREGYRLSALLCREPPRGDGNDLAKLERTIIDESWLVLEAHLTHAERVRLLARICPRQRRLILLQSAGFSYSEMSELTNQSVRTVERQLLRGKRALRRLAAR